MEPAFDLGEVVHGFADPRQRWRLQKRERSSATKITRMRGDTEAKEQG